MKRPVVASAITLLIAAAGYFIYVAIYASLTAEDYDPSLFWTAIGILFVIAAAALWAATRLYKRHFAKLS
jgi:hypothetical protein